MPLHIINRTGLPPLIFNGETVNYADGHLAADGLSRNRWHALTVYLADSGKWIVHIDYHSTFRTEVGFSEAHVCLSPDRVAYVLGQHDSTSHVQGWPPLPDYASRQRRLLNGIEQLYASLVSIVLAEPLFAVSPDTVVTRCCASRHAKLMAACRQTVTAWDKEDDEKTERCLHEIATLTAGEAPMPYYPESEFQHQHYTKPPTPELVQRLFELGWKQVGDDCRHWVGTW